MLYVLLKNYILFTVISSIHDKILPMRYIAFIFLLSSILNCHAELPEMESVGIKVTKRFDFSVTGKVEPAVGGSLVYLRSVKVLSTTSSPKSYLISGLLVDGNAGAPVVNYPLSIGGKKGVSAPVFAGMTNALGEFVIRVWIEEKKDLNSRRVTVDKDFVGYLYLCRFTSALDTNSFPLYGIGGGVIRYDLNKLKESFGQKSNAEHADKTKK